jgi:regulator of replication initiation timing|tara:strand:- start:1860 stop:2438 length:579 start_codon:yes stop_codon:yes gene_type:complete
MTTELYEINELKKKIAELELENEKLELENDKLKEDVVNKDIRWGLVGTKINYSWLWNIMTERYDGDDEYDFSKDLRKSDSIQSITWEEHEICKKLGNQIEKNINYGQGEKIEDDVNDAISELAELYLKDCLPSNNVENIIRLIKNLYNFEKGIHLKVIFNTIKNSYQDMKGWKNTEIDEAFRFINKNCFHYL